MFGEKLLEMGTVEDILIYPGCDCSIMAVLELVTKCFVCIHGFEPVGR